MCLCALRCAPTQHMQQKNNKHNSKSQNKIRAGGTAEAQHLRMCTLWAVSVTCAAVWLVSETVCTVQLSAVSTPYRT